MLPRDDVRDGCGNCDELRELDRGSGVAGNLPLSSDNVQRLPLSPDCEFHVRPGTNMIDAMLGPLIDAVPHSVSTVINLTSVAPVIESPLSITTVVVASLADANRTPATSESGMLAVPNEVCICNWVVSVRVPSIVLLLTNPTVTLKGRTVGVALAGEIGLASVGSAFTGSALTTS